MDDLTLLLLALIIGPLFIALLDVWYRNRMSPLHAWWKRENMPKQLRSASLLMSEKDISTISPMPMHGRVDQVFRTRKGLLILLDTKLRNHNVIYKSDIIQLSVYRLILQRIQKKPIADHGYIRVIVDSRFTEVVHYRKIKLLCEHDMLGLWKRYQNIKAKKVKPTCSCCGKLHPR